MVLFKDLALLFPLRIWFLGIWHLGLGLRNRTLYQLGLVNKYSILRRYKRSKIQKELHQLRHLGGRWTLSRYYYKQEPGLSWIVNFLIEKTYFSLMECGFECNVLINCNVLRYVDIDGLCQLGMKRVFTFLLMLTRPPGHDFNKRPLETPFGYPWSSLL